MMSTSIYTSSSPPLDHIAAINASASKPPIPSQPSYGIDSPLGLVSSFPFSPLYVRDLPYHISKLSPTPVTALRHPQR
jgi:hypothetical protein